MNFSEEQIYRYSRHIILKEVGGEGQKKLLESKILVIGAGGLGSPVLAYLAAAGIGTLGVVDSDVVDLSNLQRQIIHFTPDLDLPKVESAKNKIEQINPDVKVVAYNTRLTSNNIAEIINQYDFIIDGTDNFPTKFLINDACVMLRKPYSHAGILRFDGQTFTYTPGNMCYRCIFKEPPPKGAVPTCSEAGILGAVAGVIGSIQAVEALKFILNKGELLTNRLLTFNALSTKFREIKLRKNPNCAVCGNNPSIKELQDHEQPVCDLKT
ncbi:ThiF family adenylyltransferase [Melioribacteraceae bacterium 4301-Me]|uniref:HesA/MoeB/ThiF family protein n=1 Tax=Pyranulibacter aquaticus TaxID=3163344 RepID=UPI00359A2EFA